MTAPRRIKVSAPVVSLEADGKQTIGLFIGGRVFSLVGDGEDREVRGLAVALYRATSVTLEVDEHPDFRAPEDKS